MGRASPFVDTCTPENSDMQSLGFDHSGLGAGSGRHRIIEIDNTFNEEQKRIMDNPNLQYQEQVQLIVNLKAQMEHEKAMEISKMSKNQ
jgi:hypothetical protein